MDNFAFTSHDPDWFEFGHGLTANDLRSHTYPPFVNSYTWRPLQYDTMGGGDGTMHQQQQQPRQDSQAFMTPRTGQEQQQQRQIHSRPSSSHASQPVQQQRSGLGLDYDNLLQSHWQYELQQAAQQEQQQRHRQHHQQEPQVYSQQHQQQFHMPANGSMHVHAYDTASFVPQLQTSPIEYVPHATDQGYPATSAMGTNTFMTMAGSMESMNALAYPLNDCQTDIAFPTALNNAALQQHILNQQAAEAAQAIIPGSSPTGTLYEVQSNSDHEWSLVNYNTNRYSCDSAGTVSNPSQNLHIRTSSEVSSSDDPSSAGLSGSFEDIAPWPLSSPHDFHGSDYLDTQYVIQQQAEGLLTACRDDYSDPETYAAGPSAAHDNYRSSASGSASTSPTSSGPLSPPLRRRKTPLEGKTTKSVIKKAVQSTRKDATGEKKVGRRRGPLRPDQRQQAHEIRKLRACLRCKFLKKTCDKGEPCAGCRPSHARLWQVPCTRMDIKDIGYFMKDWKADHERHVSLGFSVGNIKGFSTAEQTLYITHGYGHYLPINAREVYVHDDKCFEVDWVETIHDPPRHFEVKTAKLSAGMEGVSTTLLSEYLDRHLDQSFESFVDKYFEGTPFLTEILKTAHRYYQREKTPAIRKALKLVLAYNLTMHVTMVEGLPEENHIEGRIDTNRSRFSGKTLAPVMINFQVKCALADMWRELQKDILEELSSLYSSVYSGEKLKNWPTIFMLAAILLAIWEEMQFDSRYRTPDENAVNKFCDEMETTPVGVIVGLFQAISTKLPGLQEWDTKKHHHLLGSNTAVCDALTEVKGHVDKHGKSVALVHLDQIHAGRVTDSIETETYLKERSAATFDRDDFDSLSNKFLSKLVIRAN